MPSTSEINRSRAWKDLSRELRNSSAHHDVPLISNDNCQNFQENIGVDPVAFLKVYAKKKDLYNGTRVHAYIVKMGLLGMNVHYGRNLVNMYAKCGALAKAREVFDKLPAADVVAWNALIAGYVQQGRGEEALTCFELRQHKGLSPDAITFTCILKACGSIAAADKGQKLHAEIAKGGLLQKDIMLGAALADMYIKCGVLEKAQEVFDTLPVRDAVSWNVLISGYAQNGHRKEALTMFEQMQHEGISPNAVTFTCILKVCDSIGKGQEIHAEIIKELKEDISVCTALVDMYAKCGALPEAQEVFDELPTRDVVFWNVLIAAYAQQGHGIEALNCFEDMQRSGLTPDAITFTTVLKACGSITAAEKGQEIHAEVVREGLLEKDILLGTTLMDMYARCGALAEAQDVFDELPDHDVVLWNVLIAGYVQHGHSEGALKCFDLMQREGLSPDAITYICGLKACGSVGAAAKGKEIHAKVAREGLLGNHIMVGNALVDMYAKCGTLVKAQEVFDELPCRDVVTWAALIAGYTQLGKADTTFNLFNRMLGEGVEPDSVTFSVMLNACSHFGLVDNAHMYFKMMSTDYGIIPSLEHHTCIVDLFGRAGHFKDAIAHIKRMPYFANPDLWHSLLGACKKWGNMKLGRFALEHALELDEKDATAYICMGNISAASVF